MVVVPAHGDGCRRPPDRDRLHPHHRTPNHTTTTRLDRRNRWWTRTLPSRPFRLRIRHLRSTDMAPADRDSPARRRRGHRGLPAANHYLWRRDPRSGRGRRFRHPPGSSPPTRTTVTPHLAKGGLLRFLIAH